MELKPSTDQVDLKQFRKRLLTRHRLFSIALAFLIFAFDKELAKSFFMSSMAFHIYLYLLCLGFSALRVPAILTPKQDEETGGAQAQSAEPTEINPAINPIIAVFASMRMGIVAVILGMLVIKFKLVWVGIVLAFLLHKVILITSKLSFSTNSIQGTNRTGL